MTICWELLKLAHQHIKHLNYISDMNGHKEIKLNVILLAIIVENQKFTFDDNGKIKKQ
jgi:hypothetical protein